MKTFVADNFDVNGTEFQEWTPKDWQPNPKFLSNITDIKLKEWATTLHGFWEELGRLIKDDVKDSPEKYSMIYVSHPVIVPGKTIYNLHNPSLCPLYLNATNELIFFLLKVDVSRNSTIGTRNGFKIFKKQNSSNLSLINVYIIFSGTGFKKD